MFENVVSQYIDNNGKTRIINFKTKGGEISVCISPIPPLNAPSTEKKNIKVATLPVVINFMKEKGLLIVEQDGSVEKGTVGIWVETKEQNSGIYYAYIPIIPSKKNIENVPFSTRNDPMRTNVQEESELSVFRKNRKIADILKQYTLYTYSLYPDDFDESYFTVDPNHVYDIEKLDKRLYFDGNDVIYRDGYILVPSETVRDGLMSYLKSSILNDTPGTLALAKTKTIENYYQTISDFRNIPGQLVFVNKSGLKRWKHEYYKKSEMGPSVSSFPVQDIRDPYYYKNPKIKRDSLMIVQNVIGGSKKLAISVSYKWNISHINMGFDGSISNIVDDISYIVYNESGEILKEKKKTNYVQIFQYEDGSFASLLFFI